MMRLQLKVTAVIIHSYYTDPFLGVSGANLQMSHEIEPKFLNLTRATLRFTIYESNTQGYTFWAFFSYDNKAR